MKEHASFNRCYRLLWSGTTEQWKPVPETARTAKKGGRGKAANTLTLAGVLPGVAMSLFVMSNLAAQPPPQPPAPATTQLPTGGTVVGGQATISQSAIATAANMVVNQNTQRAIIDWSSFNLGSAATVQFVQPNAQSVILNRVLDPNPSQIFGRINANGQVYLTNPYGVYFSPTATVDVGGLVATTYDIRNADFMSGYYKFERVGGSGRIVNEGALRATAGGYIALLAPEVQNSGVVLARAGTVAMAAGDEVTLTIADGKSLSGITTTASSIASLIENKLAVLAPDGQIILSAVAVNKLQAGVIKNSGSLQATSMTAKGGKIVLEGDEIELTGTATVDVSGHTGGGTVLMGGDWQGGGTMRQATKVTMAANSTINASATDNGDGGKVVLWSNVSDANSQTVVHGSIKADAGPNGGKGGQIETSGHDLNVDDIQVSTQAPRGAIGEWLLDPANITISSSADANYANLSANFTPNSSSGTSTINNATLSNALNNTSITLTTVNNGTAASSAGLINISANISWTNATTLTLVANDSISGTGNISMTGGGSLVLSTGNTTTTACYSGVISGNGSVTKQGLGNLTLSGNNTYTGNTTIAAGTVVAGVNTTSPVYNATSDTYSFTSAALGLGTIKVLNGATFNPYGKYIYNPIEIAGTGAAGSSGALWHTSSSAGGPSSYVYSTIKLMEDNARIGASTTNTDLYLFGNISSPTGTNYGFSTAGLQSVVLQGGNSFTGNIAVNGAGLGFKPNGANATYFANITVASGSQMSISADPAYTITFNGAVNGAGNVSFGTCTSAMNTVFAGVYNVTGNTTITANNTVTLTNASNFTTAANITGAGKLALSGTGVVTLTGNLSGLNGNLTVNAGSTLNLGNGGTTGILGSYVDNNGTINVNRSDNVTLASALMGTGLINKLGSNVLTLAGNSTFSGNISVRAGTLKSGLTGNASVGAFGKNATITLADVTGVTVDIAGNSTYMGSLSGGVNTTLNVGSSSATIGTNNASTTFAGQIIGSGSLTKSGTGTLTLPGNSSGLSGLTVSDGRLILTNTSVIGNSSTVIALNTATAVLELQNITTLSNPLCLSNAGTVLISSGNTTLTGNLNLSVTGNKVINVSAGSSLNLSGNITMSNNNRLIKKGLGTLAFQAPPTGGSQSLSQGLNVTEGTVIMNTTSSLIGQSLTSYVSSGATLEIQKSAQSTAGFYSGSAIVNNGTILVNENNDSNLFVNISGTGSLEFIGSAKVNFMLGGSYTGGTTIRAGSKAYGSVSSYGDANSSLVNNGMLYMWASDYDFVQNISGTGSVEISNTVPNRNYTVGIKGNNTYTGGTNISFNGSVVLGGNATTGASGSLGTGNITLSSNLSTLEIRNTGGLTFGNNISGVGNFAANASGTVVLTGVNNYTGSTTIADNRSLTIDATSTWGSNGNYSGAIVFGTNATLDYAGAGDLNLTGNLTQISTTTGGVLRKSTRTSNLTLTGNNSYTGGTFIDAGTVYALGSTSATGRLGTGNITVNSSLVINRSGAFLLSNFSGNIAGTGNVTILSQDNNVTIDRNITLTGDTSIIKVMAGSTLAAGNVTGNVTLSNNISTGTNGTIVLFAGAPTTINTTTLLGKMAGASGALKYKTYNATLSSLGNAVAGTRNFFYRNQPSATLTGGTVTAVKVYDGTTTANATYTGTGAATGIDGDSLTGTVLSANYNSSSAGSKTLNVSLAITSNTAGWALAGYNGTISGASTTATITKAPLTVKANDDARFVTFSDTVGYTGASYSGFVNNETLATSGVTGTLAIARSSASNAAGTYALTPSGLSANNYNITFANGTYTIVPAQQLIVRVNDGTSVYGNTPNLTVASASYLMPDNVTIVNLTGNLSVSNAGLYSLQDGASGSASFNLGLVNATMSTSNRAAVGVWNVGYSNLNKVGVNFNNMTVVGTQTITPRTLNITATATNKEYDGNTNVSLVLTKNLLGSDVVNTTADTSGLFADKNAGTGKTVTVSNISISGGADAGNYILGSNVATTTANITPKGLSLAGLTATDKVYDGTTNATVAFTSFTGLVGLDDVQVANTGTFSDKNVGIGKTVTVSGLALSGADAGNYQLSSATTVASITPKTLNISGLSAVVSKVYDGTTTASPLGTASLLALEAPGTGTSSDGKAFTGDVVSLSGTPTGTYNSKDVATAANVTLAGLTLTGAQAGNYVLAMPAPITANITPAPLVVRANDDANFVLVANAAGYAGASYSGFVNNENATSTGFASALSISRSDAANVSAGTYTLTPSGLTSTNYNVSYQTGTYTIVPAQTLLIRVSNDSSVYGSSANMNVTSASYLMSDNTTIVNLTNNLSLSSGLYTVQDGASGSATFNLGLTNVTLSHSGNTAVGIWNVGYSNLNKVGVNFNDMTVIGTQTVTAKAINVTATAANKEYNGNTNATMTLSSADVISGDNISYAYSNANFISKNVGTNKTATATNLTLCGDDAINYAIQNLVAEATANITAKTLNVSGITATNKVYDGNTTATINTSGVTNATLVSGGMVAGDNVVVSATGSFADKNVNTSILVTLSSTYSGADAGNYNINSQANTTANITAKVLTISGITAADKVYDGNTTATTNIAGVTNAVLLAGGLVAGDNVTVSATGTFADKNVNTSKVVTLNSTYGGTDVGNYNITSQTNTTANITAKTLNITGITANTKVYDGNTSATINTSGVTNATLVSGGMVAGDSVTVSATGAFADKNANLSKVVMLTSTYGGTDVSNYNITSQTFTQTDITPKTLNISGITAANKVYDGNTTATINTAGVTNASLVSGGMVTGDNVTVAATGTFADKNVNTSKVVTLSSTYGGADAGNYNITSQVNTTANITPKALTISGITADNKVYDGNTNATINTSGVTNATLVSGGMVAGDNVTVSSSGTFANKNANTSILVTLNSTYGGADASNYNITSQTNTTANITAKAVTLTASQVTRAYDGTANYTTLAADLTALSAQLGIAGDSVTGITLAYLDKNVGTNKTVTATGATLSDGNNGLNYNLSYANSSVSAITPKAITLTGITADNKVYDGTTTATVNTSGVTNATWVTAGMIVGDALTVSATGTFADKNAGTNKVVTLNSTYGGADAGNYNITSQVNTTADITPKSLTVTGLSAPSSKVYDGTTTATLLTSGQLQSASSPGAGNSTDGKPYTGDTVNLAGTPTGTYNSKDVATAANLSISGLSLSGSAAGNYVLTTPTPIAATITPAPLVVRANDDARFVTLSDSVGYAGASYNGFVSSETLATSGVTGALAIARSDSANGAAGSYTLTPSGLTASNYNLSYQTGTYTIVPAQTLLIRVGSTSTLYGNAMSLNVTNASYLMSDNVTIVNLTSSLSVSNGLYTVQDGASGAASFNLGVSNVTMSGSGHVPVGIWNVGTSNLTKTSSNFVTLAAVGTQTVTAKSITVSATAANKAYDGNTNATVTLSSADVLTGDAISYGFTTASFASNSVEANKSVAITNISLAGGDAQNYRLQNLMATATADITAASNSNSGGGGGGGSNSSDDLLTSQRALAVTTQTAERSAPTRVVTRSESRSSAEAVQTPSPTRASASGVLPVAVIEDNRMSNLGMTYEQQPNDIHIQLTTAPAITPPAPTLLRFSGNFKTFLVMNDQGEAVPYQGAVIGKRMVILADTASAKRLARIDMQTVLAAAITTLGADQPISLSELESVVMDLR